MFSSLIDLITSQAVYSRMLLLYYISWMCIFFFCTFTFIFYCNFYYLVVLVFLHSCSTFIFFYKIVFLSLYSFWCPFFTIVMSSIFSIDTRMRRIKCIKGQYGQRLKESFILVLFIYFILFLLSLSFTARVVTVLFFFSSFLISFKLNHSWQQTHHSLNNS